MAKVGFVNRQRYDIHVSDQEIEDLLCRRQVWVVGTHIYLYWIVPSPIRGKRPELPSYVKDNFLYKKGPRKQIHINASNLYLVKEGKELVIKCFHIFKGEPNEKEPQRTASDRSNFISL